MKIETCAKGTAVLAPDWDLEKEILRAEVGGGVTGGGGTSKRLAHSHQRKDPAKLILVDSEEIWDGVEFLFSQHLFRHLWKHHAINHSVQEGVALVERAQ